MTDQNLPAVIANAMTAVQDRETSIENRAAMYALLHQVQLRINRALKVAKPDLLHYVREHGALGPVTVSSKPKDVRWPCNDEGNWGDSGVQDAMRELAEDATTTTFVRHIPEHFEVIPLAITNAMRMGDPAAKRLYTELKRRKWRTEDGERDYTLAIAEAKPGKAA